MATPVCSPSSTELVSVLTPPMTVPPLLLSWRCATTALSTAPAMLAPRSFLRLRDLRANRNRASRPPAEQPRDTTIVHDRSTFPSARRTANGFQRLAEPSALDVHPDGNALGFPCHIEVKPRERNPSILDDRLPGLRRSCATDCSPTRCGCHHSRRRWPCLRPRQTRDRCSRTRYRQWWCRRHRYWWRCPQTAPATVAAMLPPM